MPFIVYIHAIALFYTINIGVIKSSLMIIITVLFVVHLTQLFSHNNILIRESYNIIELHSHMLTLFNIIL